MNDERNRDVSTSADAPRIGSVTQSGKSKTSILPLLIGVAVPTLLIGGFIAGSQWGGSSSTGTIAPVVVPTAPTSPDPTAPPAPDEPTPVPGQEEAAAPKGTNGPGTPYVFSNNPEAPTLAIVEDFACPACAAFAAREQPEIFQAVDEGRIQLKIYTVAFLANGDTKAAEAVACAAEQDAFKPYSTLVYQAQRTDGKGLAPSKLEQLANKEASEIRDIPQFAACLEAGTYKQYVDSVTAAGVRAAIPGTPGLFFDGEFAIPDAEGITRLQELLSGATGGE